MTFRQLQAFLLVVRTGTLAAAAEHMGLTQSGVSRLVTELSRNVGFELFTRVGRGVTPTTQGMAFFRIAEGVYDSAESLQRAAAEIRAGIEERVRLACLPTIGAAVMPAVLESFHRDYPNAFVDIYDQHAKETVEAFHERKLDFAVTHKVGHIEGIHTEAFAVADYVFAVHKDHELATQKVIRNTDLSGHSHVGFESETMFLPNDDETRLIGEVSGSISKRIWCQSSVMRYALLANKRNVNIAEPFSLPLFTPHGIVARRFEPRVAIEMEFVMPTENANVSMYVDLKRAFRKATSEFAARHDLPIFVGGAEKL